MFFKQVLSYFIPIKIYEISSEINTNLEVTLNNGKLVLDSKSTNFSYGSLQRVLRIGLKEIGYERIREFNTILILGIAGGSVVKTLVDEVNFKGKIAGIEIDPKTIEIGNKYFGLNTIENLEIKISDAENFISNCNQNFDFIIIDVFQDDTMPDFLFESAFFTKVLECLSHNGKVLFNTIKNSRLDSVRNEKFEQLLIFKSLIIKKLSNIEGANELFIIEK